MNEAVETTTLGLTQEDVDRIKEGFNKFADAIAGFILSMQLGSLQLKESHYEP